MKHLEWKSATLVWLCHPERGNLATFYLLTQMSLPRVGERVGVGYDLFIVTDVLHDYSQKPHPEVSVRVRDLTDEELQA